MMLLFGLADSQHCIRKGPQLLKYKLFLLSDFHLCFSHQGMLSLYGTQEVYLVLLMSVAWYFEIWDQMG